MIRPIDVLISQAERMPEVSDNPIAREWLEVIRNGDAERGEQIARNLCDNNGVTVEQALQRARQIMGL